MVAPRYLSRPASMLGCLIGMSLCLGCQSRQMVWSGGAHNGGLVVVLPGIDGRAPHNEKVCKILAEEHPDLVVELFDWTSPLGPAFNQCAMQRNRQVALEVAKRVSSYLRDNPSRPVYMVGHSGGTAIAVWAAETLPAEVRVDGIILLASSLSPNYDLSAALAHTRRGVVSFRSDRDAALLGAGTSLLGTMDGPHTEAAGKVGFQRPRRSARDYNSLFEVAWTPSMTACGHDGGHFGYTAAEFIRQHVAPLMAGRPWQDQLGSRLDASRTSLEQTLAMNGAL